MTHPNEIELGGVELTEQSYEAARVWVTHNAGSSVWIDARVIEEPKVFGYLMADTIRHAAFAYSRVWNLDQDEALQAIVDGLAEELREQFNEVTTIQDGSLS
jgi:hypothetical protein